MGVDVDIVTKPEYEGRQKVIDERFDRDKERISRLEEIQTDMVKLNTQFAEIIRIERSKQTQVVNDIDDLKKVAVRLEEVVNTLTKNDENKECRLSKLESEPKNKLDKIYGWVFGTIVGAVIGFVMKMLLK